MTDHARAIEAGARAIDQFYSRSNIDDVWLCHDKHVNGAMIQIDGHQLQCTWDQLQTLLELIQRANGAAITSGELVPASAGQRTPLDWGKLVQCILRCMDATIKNESSREQAERIATVIEERFGTVPASATKPYSSAEFLTSPEALDEYVKEMVASAVAEMRERCAREANDRYRDFAYPDLMRLAGESIAAAIRSIPQAPASGEFVVVPRSDLQVVVDIAGRNESAIEIECIKEWLKDAASSNGGGK